MPAAPSQRRSGGKRRADVSRLSALPTSVVLGAAALVVAGSGAVALSATAAARAPANPNPAMSADLQAGQVGALGHGGGGSGDHSNGDGGSRLLGARSGLGGGQPVSRNSDRDLAPVSARNLAKQATVQARQRNAALAQLVKQTKQRVQRVDSRQWVLPLARYELTAGFGETSSLWATVHTGLDFAAPAGAPLLAVAAGKITSTRYAGPYGYRTVLTLTNGTEVWYCHQTSFARRPGRDVRPGELVGYVGSTGNATGPHLHLEVRPDGRAPVNPVRALLRHGVRP